MTFERASDHYRIFVALAVPDVVRDAIAQVQMRIRRALPEGAIRWTRPEQFHLTLKFLGNVETPRLGSLVESLRAACSCIMPLHLRLRGIGAFPTWRRPRVIWVSIESLHGGLPQLERAVEAACSEFAPAKPSRSYDKVVCDLGRPIEETHNDGPVTEETAGHVTLGRIKKITRSQAVGLEESASLASPGVAGEWNAGQVEIMRSRLTPHGAQYTLVADIP